MIKILLECFFGAFVEINQLILQQMPAITTTQINRLGYFRFMLRGIFYGKV